MDTVIVGERGQVTIPKKLRDRFGIKSKSPVVFELREDGIMIKPALTVTVREFSDDFIREISESDRLKTGERKDVLARWKRR
ncbi:MAG TPA: AbrB/MazE/SpoVT family DNA-binding domain-containing protein [Dissulfurispiraceae bacterium]|nr:AbrB/MazE/SpoVT family DNA-binding domain-containing protein [Dissulfurispiraceae bacterium]